MTARALAMDQPREKPLTRAGFALQEDRGKAPGRLVIMTEKLGDLGTDGNDPGTFTD